jgi:thioesterase domain-containing protein
MTAQSPLVPLRPTGTKLPLHCVHPVTGSAFAYLPLTGLLGADQPVYGLEAPGYDDDQPLLTRMAELTGRYLQAITDQQPGVPVCLLGWSMGGVVAFDMAQQHAAAGGDVPLLVLVEAPVIDPPEPVPSPAQILGRFVFDLSEGDPRAAAYVDTVLAETQGDSEATPDPARVLAGLTLAGVIPTELDLDLLVHRYAVFSANVEAFALYRYRAGYHQPVVNIRASSSPPEWVAWHKFADEVHEYVVPGDHFSIWRGDALEELASIVARHLDQLPHHTNGGSA